MHFFKTWWFRSIFKKRKLKEEFHALLQDLMGQIYFEREKIERRIWCTYSGLDGSDILLRRENWMENFMHFFRTWWVKSIFMERKLKREFHALLQDLMGQIYFYGEKIERRISCTSSGLDGSGLFLRRENWKDNFLHLFSTWWVRSIFKERKLKGEFHVLIQDLIGQIYL